MRTQKFARKKNIIVTVNGSLPSSGSSSASVSTTIVTVSTSHGIRNAINEDADFRRGVLRRRDRQAQDEQQGLVLALGHDPVDRDEDAERDDAGQQQDQADSAAHLVDAAR